ncbi:serine/threonine protein phosphatase, partial [Micrococcus luteus]|nr:serine/threonine protein phosphatase [Micrococcus luteus]
MTTIFDHLRADDREHVGYIEMTDDGLFIPYDLLRRRCGEPMELAEAEELLDTVGLQALGEQWLLRTEGDAWVPVDIREFSRE